MPFTLLTLFLAAALFVGMLLCMELGRWLGARHPGQTPRGVSVLEGAVFGLLGLLVAFTFSGAITRLDMRRQLIVQEANAIGTAYLRLDVLPAETQPALREAFRQYLDARLEAYQHPPGSAVSLAGLERSGHLQGEIWSRAVVACRSGNPAPPAVVVLPALNDMIDITATRAMSQKMHPPVTIYVMLCLLALVSALLAGNGLAESPSRSRIHTVGFAAIFAITVYVILDMEYPRQGLIRVDAADQVLVDLRASMQ